MKLTFIKEDLALLSFGELAGLAYARRRAYLIENSIGVVKVGIDGPREIFVVSLCPHKRDTGSKDFVNRTSRYFIALLWGAPVTAIKAWISSSLGSWMEAITAARSIR